MLAAALSGDQAERFCSQTRCAGCLSVAAFDSPSLVTISGDYINVAQAMAEDSRWGIFH
jgi:hypothetical protein